MGAPAANYEELQAEIGRRFPGLSRQLQRIARFALERPQEVALDTVAAAAGKAEVQPSAMVRFAQALGYDGYTDMQRIFRDRLVQRSGSYRERIASLRRAAPALSRPKAVLHDFVTDSIAHLSHLEEHVAPERLDHAVRLLAGAERIHVLAQRRAFPVACYLGYALAQLELPVQLIDGVGGMAREQARAIRPGDALVAVSFRNYSPEVIELAADAWRRGIDVVVITDSAVSPLARSATVAFDLGDPSDRPFRSLVEPLCLAQALVVSVGHQLAETENRGQTRVRPRFSKSGPGTGQAPVEEAMTAPSFELACMGRAAVDLYGEQVGAPLEDTATFARYLGGSPANTAVGAARLGLGVAMITRVGDEQNGRFVRATLEREGVDVSQVSTDPRRLTALVFLAIRGPGDFPHVFYRDNCADMALAEGHLDAAFLARCRAVLISGTHLSAAGPMAACERAAREVRAAGGRVILDIDYRPVLWGLARPADGAERATPSAEAARRIGALLPLCDLVVGTEEEFMVAGAAGDVMSALRNVRAATAALLVIKLGPRGCTAFGGAIPDSLESGVHMPGFPVEVFNVLGAGDGFMAGFLRGWLRGEPLENCGRLANACGALVVSRHGCAPAMPSAEELQHFLDHGAASPRVREDATIEHLHRATARRRVATPLLVLAFDHRTQLEALAGTRAAERIRIPQFKSLVAEAFLRVSEGRSGTGAIVDDRYGGEILARLTGHGYWIARPVEKPGAIPLAFDAGDNVGLAMRAWPTEHVAKCLVAFHPDDSAELQAAQLARIETIAEACAATGRELLLEIVPPAGASADPMTIARALEAVYANGVKPDWWKLPPQTQPASWRNVDQAIERFDPLCRGVLVLGMEAAADRLREGFAAAARSPWVRGFAVGRSIFAPAAEAWFKGDWNDAQAVDDVAARYEEVIGMWESRDRIRETA